MIRLIDPGKKSNASALGYAISFLLLVGLICCGVLFISSVNKRLEMNYTMQEHLVFDNYLSLTLGANTREKQQITLFHPAGDTSDIFIKPWGAYKVVTANTRHSGRFITKSALIGYPIKTTLPSLYLADNNQSLKLCGNTKIEGEVFLPERGVDRSYIGGKHYENDQLIYGIQKKSETYLPALNPVYADLRWSTFIREGGSKMAYFSRDSIFSFDHETTIISQITPLYLKNKIQGNVILHSFDSIIVTAAAQLENVILISPCVRFEEGFKGSVQVIAHQKIICEKNVKLLYPSTLVLNEIDFNQSETSAFVRMQEGAKVIGGILLTSQQPNFRKPVQLDIASGATVGGLVFNTGETLLYGKIIGNIYTQTFKINAGGGVYTNNLLDVLISSVRLPKDFLYPDWLKEMELKTAKIITCF